jgi:hypothetical protein
MLAVGKDLAALLGRARGDARVARWPAGRGRASPGAIREADFELDGWCLEDGEARHREAPETFWIPALADRGRLGLGEGDLEHREQAEGGAEEDGEVQ